jgi:hypothetical protein
MMMMMIKPSDICFVYRCIFYYLIKKSMEDTMINRMKTED